jgi:hypothetical protein
MLAYHGGVPMEAVGMKVCHQEVPAIMVQQPVQQPPLISFLPIPVSMPPSPQRRPSVELTNALSEIDLQPWLEAARDFEMNLDFEVHVNGCSVNNSLDSLMDVMKAQSDGKWTIQALADKIMLSRMMDNLGVPQMPALLIVERPDVDYREIENFVLCHLCGPNSYDVVVKPTHMSNAAGVINVSRPTPAEGPQMTIDYLAWHLKHFMQEKAGTYESAALQSTRPGFIVQPKYESVVDFKAPLEVRVVVLWGKARLAVWWWGHAGTSPHCHRNVWLVRCPAQRGELGEADSWQVIHMHNGANLGFQKAIELFERHIAAMVELAEVIATAVGAPFLRSDFFVGSPQWGVRLNEVAYGSGIEYVNFSDTMTQTVVDDSTAIAQILREGYMQCQRRLPSSHFLWKLGVRGHGYGDMAVMPIPPHLRPPLPPCAQGSGNDPLCLSCAVPEDLCATVPDVSRMPRPSLGSWRDTSLVEAQSSSQILLTPRGSRCRKSSPVQLQQSPHFQTPRQWQGPSLSPRRHSHVQAATPTPLAPSPVGSACVPPNGPMRSSGTSLPGYQTSVLVPPATPTMNCRVPTPTRASPGPMRGQRGSASMSGTGDMLMFGYPSPTPALPGLGDASWSNPPPSVATLPSSLGEVQTGPRRSFRASSAMIPQDGAWRQQGACSTAAIPAPLGTAEVMPTPPPAFRTTRMFPGPAPSRTPPSSWRSLAMGGGDVTATLQAARHPRPSMPTMPSWQANAPTGLLTPPPGRCSLAMVA